MSKSASTISTEGTEKLNACFFPQLCSCVSNTSAHDFWTSPQSPVHLLSMGKKKKSPCFNICKQLFNLRSAVTHIHIMCLVARPKCSFAIIRENERGYVQTKAHLSTKLFYRRWPEGLCVSPLGSELQRIAFSRKGHVQKQIPEQNILFYWCKQPFRERE